ncbi:coenzyme A biosynthesis bifunctional protein CoaBC [Ferrovum sp. JA12]|uniref:bifunctional phosphopantothenoylcysteine decarboxylase/phosphopantothenate--cysteine ligase CoaBC n=1 Tax=Ferrovum sp. JA12 TaxID=1356299 RepID=UPI000702FB04|nr:bifunctional phosphopantothenoylcysteine decarboxylase/phosphopantothenate--cysteine ligase CoaBC [Ferrovum sp. JA12]KRH78190.1 coenzyme A biosynthesis bifunctional protein CoaBC [Ferrovum sp. JA12]
MNNMQNKHILLGVCGGIAAYKSAYLVRLLQNSGFSVQVMMTEAATHFVTPVTFQALSGQAVLTDIWDPRIPNRMAHIEATRIAQAMLIAPATSNVMAKLATGIADDLLTTTALARNCPLLVAPAMNREMWGHPSTRRNIEQLQRDGVNIIGPASGHQACGEVGEGRMEEPEIILLMLKRALTTKHWEGRRVLVTAGPTLESIDPVRAITNHSSGKMGYAIVDALIAQGAEVTLITGPVALSSPVGAKVIAVMSAEQMLHAVHEHIENQDVFFSVAAVADYRPEQTQAQKIKKSGAPLALQLTATVDILASVTRLPKPPFCVGFAAETNSVNDYAQHKRVAKNIPVIVANHAQHALGQEDNEVVIIDETGQYPLAKAHKSEVAERIIEHVLKLL